MIKSKGNEGNGCCSGSMSRWRFVETPLHKYVITNVKYSEGEQNYDSI